MIVNIKTLVINGASEKTKLHSAIMAELATLGLSPTGRKTEAPSTVQQKDAEFFNKLLEALLKVLLAKKPETVSKESKVYWTDLVYALYLEGLITQPQWESLTRVS